MRPSDAAKWLFSARSETTPWWRIVVWWEARRIPYNFLVGIVAFPCLILFYLFVYLADELQPGEDALEPMALFAAPVLVNAAYTAGWIVELLLRALLGRMPPATGPALLKLGLALSLVCIATPPIFWFMKWLA